MHLYNSQAATVVRMILIGVVFLSIAVGTVFDVMAESRGYVSPNPVDLPPDMDRKVTPSIVDPDRPPAYGPEDAKVLVIIFADYQCPACRRASQATHQIAAEFPGDVRMEFWNHPLASHRNADLAAAAGIAAQQQGKFWEMHDILFENSKHDMATLEQHAQDMGLDLEKFRSDMNDPAVKERIRKEGELTEDVAGGKIRFPRRGRSQDFLVLGAFIGTCGHVFKRKKWQSGWVGRSSWPWEAGA